MSVPSEPSVFTDWLHEVPPTTTHVEVEWHGTWTVADLTTLTERLPALQELDILPVQRVTTTPATCTETDFLNAAGQWPHLVVLHIEGPRPKGSATDTEFWPGTRALVSRLQDLRVYGLSLERLIRNNPATEFSSLRHLRVSGRMVALTELLARCPVLETLVCHPWCRDAPEVTIQHDHLRSLTLWFMKGHKLKPVKFTISGAAPALRELYLSGQEGMYVDPDPLRELLTRNEGLEKLTLYVPDAWDLCAALSRTAPSPGRVDLNCANKDSDGRGKLLPLNSQEWTNCLDILERGWMLNTECIVDLLRTQAMLDENPRGHLAVTAIAAATKVNLNIRRGGLTDENYHGWIVGDASRLVRLFPNLSTLNICSCAVLTTASLDAIVLNLPHLADLDLTDNDNDNLATVRLHSPSLRTVRLWYFHNLVSYDLDLPGLTDLTLNCCGYSAAVEDWAKPVVRSSFCERLLADLLRAPRDQQHGQLTLPLLRRFSAFHNNWWEGTIRSPNDDDLADVDCSAGHASLEEIELLDCVNFKRFCLKGVPKMRVVEVKRRDEGGPVVCWKKGEGSCDEVLKGKDLWVEEAGAGDHLGEQGG
ncbi:hypothetical protein HDU89_008639 [Geranomyces variabilis]|nr:hypothetical protein HDU89_008639 [Geranomyces variabilis]